MAHDTRDAVVDFGRTWAEKTEIAVKRFARWLGIQPAKFFDWQARYGKANEHNGLVPRDHWLEEDERRAILEYHSKFPLEGYRHLTFMMLDADVVAASPATVYRVLKKSGLLDRWNLPCAATRPAGTTFGRSRAAGASTPNARTGC